MGRVGIIMLFMGIALAVQLQAKDWKSFEEFKRDVVLHPDKASEYAQDFINDLKREGTPLIEGNRVTFIYLGVSSADTLPKSIAGDFNRWTKDFDWLVWLPGTDIYYKTFEFPLDARIDYQFVIGEDWILDAYNPDTIMSGYGPRSELNMPGYVEANEIRYDPSITHGRIIEDSIYSEKMGEMRRFKVYTPADFDKSLKYPSIYVHDGYEFISIAHLENVLDNMIYQKRIPPLIAVFIPPIDRFEEYFGKKKYAAFIVKELVPYVDENYPTINSAKRRCTTGISAGGTISLALGWYFPEVFGLILSQSGVLYVDEGNNKYPIYFAEEPKKDLKFYIDVGVYEWLWLLESNRNFKKILDEKNYPNLYMEFNEGHSWGSWRSHIKYGLEYLFGS